MLCKDDFVCKLYRESIAQFLAIVLITYSLIFTFWGDNSFRLVLLYIEFIIGCVSIFTGLGTLCFSIKILTDFNDRLNGQAEELIFKILLCCFGFILSCYFTGLIWDWLSSMFYSVVSSPVDMKWFLWEFFITYNFIQNQVDVIGDIHSIVNFKTPYTDVPTIGQLAIGKGFLTELQLEQMKRQQMLWKKRAFKKLLRQSKEGKESVRRLT